MNLNHLRHFYTVVKQGSFSSASEVLFVSQPAVSKSVSELENFFGVTLLNRSTKGRKMRLTHEGRRLYEYARSLFAIERSAIADMQALKALQEGTLRLGTTPTIANYWLAPYIKDFKQLYPKVTLSIQVASTPDISNALIDYEIDLGLIEGGNIPDPLLKTSHWRDEELMFITANNSGQQSRKITRSVLNQSVWLLREQNSMTRNMVDRILNQNQISPQRIIEIGSNEAIARHVAAGLGVSLLPRATVADLIELKQVSEINLNGARGLQRSLLILDHPDENMHSFTAKAFLALLFRAQG